MTGPTSRTEYEQHLIDCPACPTELDPDGTLVPVDLCSTGVALEYAAQWDDGIEEFFTIESQRLLATVFPEDRR